MILAHWEYTCARSSTEDARENRENQPQAGLDLWEVRANRTKMQGTALTALEPLVFPRIGTETALVLAPFVDGMLSQPANACCWRCVARSLWLGVD